MSEQQQVLQKMAELYKLASDGISRQEFLESFKSVVALVSRTNAEMLKRNDDTLSSLTEQVQKLYTELESKAESSFAEFKEMFSAKLEKALEEQQAGMNLMYDKANSLRSIQGPQGIPGPEGKSIVGPQGEPGKDGSPDTATEIRDKIESLTGEERLDASAVKNLPEFVEKTGSRVGWGAHPLRIEDDGVVVDKVARTLNFTGGTLTRDADGTINIPVSTGGGTEVWSEVPTGSGTTFTLAHTPLAGTLRLYRGGARQKATDDYTLAVATITLGVTLATGEILLCDYKY